MHKLRITKASSQEDFQGILDLQAKNHLEALSEEEKRVQGFVTVKHELEQLEAMNKIAPHIIAKEDGMVVGYLLAMTQKSRDLIPILIPMFEQFDRIKVDTKRVSDFRLMVVGQVCVGKNHRGKGVFEGMYQAYKEAYASAYDFAITEIACINSRSMAAHQRLGFQVIHEFEDETQAWAIVRWNWK
jgi:predicted GNAT superfamily acetyltransferase